MRLICLVSPAGTVCTTQNTNGSLPDVQRNVKGIPCVYFETLSSYCELPKRRELGLKGRDGRLKLVNSGAERGEWRHKMGFIFELSLRTDVRNRHACDSRQLENVPDFANRSFYQRSLSPNWI